MMRRRSDGDTTNSVPQGPTDARRTRWSLRHLFSSHPVTRYWAWKAFSYKLPFPPSLRWLYQPFVAGGILSRAVHPYSPPLIQVISMISKRFSPRGRSTRIVLPTSAFMRARPIGELGVTSTYSASAAPLLSPTSR